MLVAWPVAAVELTAETGMRFEENRTRAEAAADQINDTAAVVSVLARQRWRLDPLTSLSLEGGLDGRWWTRFENTSRIAAGVDLRLRRRLGLAFGAPWVEARVGLSGLKHRDSKVRDGGVATAGVIGGKRFGHRFDARVGYAYRVRRAARDRVFDTEQHEAFGQLDWQLTPRWLLYAGVNAIEGEITSVATLPNRKIRAAANAVLEDFDRSFERGPSPLGIGERPRWAYQLDGVVLSGEAGFNYPLTRRTALDVAARYVQASAAGDNKYNGYIVNAGILWQF